MGSKVREQLKDICMQILSASKNELYLAMRFLDIPLSSLGYELNMSTFFVATDGDMIYFQPRFLIEKYKYDRVLVNRAYLHMIMHCIFRHLYQTDDKDEEIWNLSCDIAVEAILDEMEYGALKQLVSERRKEAYELLRSKIPVLNAESVYQYLKSGEVGISDILAYQAAFLVDDHCFWRAKKKDKEKEQDQSQNDSKGQDQNDKDREQQMQKGIEKWKKASEKMQTNLETFSKNIGTESKSLLEQMQIENREKYDYRSFLKKFAVVKEEMQCDMDAFDYAFYHYGMELYGNMPLLEELEYKEVNRIEEFAVAIDTSGSCSSDLVKAFLEETFAILKSTETFAKKVNVHIIQCDNQIQEDTVITSEEEMQKYLDGFEIKGRGGTDFRPVFTHINELMEDGELTKLKGMLYFTDGFGVYPAKRPSYDVAFVFFKDDYTDEEVPVWAMKVVLDSNELKALRNRG
ncbi:MAG: metallopeptidase [Lachnospiraceae bacterium]|nr:metallopeptidase [Lachnospiraceae bacterium]